MNRVVYTLLALLGLSFSKLEAQRTVPKYRASGSVFTEESKTYIKELRPKIETWDDSSSRGFTDVPVKIHIVSKSDGSKGMDIAAVKEGIRRLNEIYAQAYLRFVPLDAYGQILNDDFYVMSADFEDDLCANYEEKGVLNLFIVNKIRSASGGCCAYTYPYSPISTENKNRIFITQRCFSNGVMLARQVSLYYGLFPTSGPDEERSEELVDGSNCKTEGDCICDTPADPGLSAKNIDSRCKYISSNLKDGKNKFYRPLTDNMASDNPRSECMDGFTRQQLQHIMFIANELRNDLVFPKLKFSKKEIKNLKKYNGIEGAVKLLVDGTEASASIKGNLLKAQKAGKRIQLDIITKRKSHIYVFEGDTGRAVQLVYPLQNDQQYLKDEEVSFSVPMQKNYIEVPAGAKRSYYCVLFTRKPINKDELLKYMNDERLYKFTPWQKINMFYERALLPTNEINYSLGKGIEFDALATERYILPVVFELSHE